MPPSSRVKKILKWNGTVFELDHQDIKELQEQHITDIDKWQQFQKVYQSFSKQDHPSNRSRSLGVAITLWTLFSIVLLLLLYVFFIILQLALFNLIMLVVMMVTWWRACKISATIIDRNLKNGQRKPYKAFIRKLKEIEWLKELQLEIQEEEKGLWIEIHLSESVDDKDTD